MLKNLVIWLVIGLVLMTVFNQFNTRQAAQAPMEYSQFLDEVKGIRLMANSIYNGWRLDDVWLDR